MSETTTQENQASAAPNFDELPGMLDELIHHIETTDTIDRNAALGILNKVALALVVAEYFNKQANYYYGKYMKLQKQLTQRPPENVKTPKIEPVIVHSQIGHA